VAGGPRVRSTTAASASGSSGTWGGCTTRSSSVCPRPIYRGYHFDELTKRGLWAFTENYVLALSHDEVTHGKAHSPRRCRETTVQKFANLRLLYGYQWTQPGKKLLFMGQEFAQWSECTTRRRSTGILLDWEPHRGVLRWIADLNAAYIGEPALHELDTDPAGYRVVDLDGGVAVLGYERHAIDGQVLLALCNFTPITRERSIRVTHAGYWVEILNSDGAEYGRIGDQQRGRSFRPKRTRRGGGELVVTAPPLGCVLLRWDGK